MKQYFNGVNKKKSWIIIAVVVIILVVFLGTRMHKNGGSCISITTPKKVSFVQQSKGSGTHVWLKTWSESGEITKNDIVHTIFVMKNGKTQSFKIFDNNVTLGKLSSMSDADTIKLAERQNKKYFTTGAIQEIKNFKEGKPGVEQYGDLPNSIQNVANGYIYLHYTYKEDLDSESEEVTKEAELLDQDIPNNIYPTKDKAVEAENKSLGGNNIVFNRSMSLNRIDEASDKVNDLKFASAIINHIKNTPYREPEQQTLSIKNITDNSGNKIDNQKIMYKTIAYYSSSKAEKNAYKIANKNKADALQLIHYASGNHITYSEFAKDNDLDPIKMAEAKVSLTKANTEVTKLNQKLFKDKYSEITKGVYGYYKIDDDFTIGDPTSQKIYKSRYIGYRITSDGGGHILTKAQNDKQKAVLAK